jgi:alcohol dehydrogenase
VERSARAASRRQYHDSGGAVSLRADLIDFRPGGTLSRLGVYSHDLRIPLAAFATGPGDQTIVTTLCPGGKERMRRLIKIIASGRGDLHELVTHRFRLNDIEKSYDLFANQCDGVLKLAITP